MIRSMRLVFSNSIFLRSVISRMMITARMSPVTSSLDSAMISLSQKRFPNLSCTMYSIQGSLSPIPYIVIRFSLFISSRNWSALSERILVAQYCACLSNGPGMSIPGTE